jgi:putative transposase
MAVLMSLVKTLRDCARSRAVLQLEVLALRHQLRVLQRAHPHRLPLTRVDRLLWVWLSQAWNQWRTALVIVKPETVIAWHRRGFVSSGRGRAGLGWVGRPPLRRFAR